VVDWRIRVQPRAIRQALEFAARARESSGALPRSTCNQRGEQATVVSCLLGDGEKDRLDVDEVLIKRRRRCAGRTRDVGDLEVPVRRRGEQLDRALDQPLARGETAPPRHPPVDGAQS